MTENMKESQKNDLLATEYYTPAAIQQIYEEAESKYGPGFAQYCVDLLTKKQPAERINSPKHHQIKNVVQLTQQLYTLSDVCNADPFHEWATEDKHSYILLLKTVTEDISHALQRSLMDLKVSNDLDNPGNNDVYEVTINEHKLKEAQVSE